MFDKILQMISTSEQQKTELVIFEKCFLVSKFLFPKYLNGCIFGGRKSGN
jgi:hypothetical protein